ncbi:uncharacterized protein TrAFT101_002056 [Trichoderma asperellum]|uniref:uncharacterized protein n=1 Tax=Trichoderma asperellum TaxID=101201 RepID=UPI00331825ED|nr:hypothetical protein TrAFT101_002056 [Trichoderma asperellum]
MVYCTAQHQALDTVSLLSTAMDAESSSLHENKAEHRTAIWHCALPLVAFSGSLAPLRCGWLFVPFSLSRA